ncbi:phage tail protein I [Kocuria flava]|uniref:phage tail protein I n=1 Tax=Kocuria flava TaxID=446860 RepID=UPI001FF3F96B|nr:phage tail protein I [Kocuria flava]MCJ8505885.1 phage tail protein I [Kocuria flava]
MRGRIPGLSSPVPLASRLPAVLQEDEFLRRFLASFDESLAPVFLTLDGLASYVDPRLAPADFVNWLAEWVGVRVDEHWPVPQRREIVANGARIHRRRGTAAGIADAVRLAAAGVTHVDIEDSGGTEWSRTPDTQLPGTSRAELHVRVHATSLEDVDARRLDAVIRAVKPAHVQHTFEVVTTSENESRGD